MPKQELQATDCVINYEVRGEGEPILFLHGSGVSWGMWEPQIEYVSKHYKMIMVDLRGHGESTKEFPDDKYSPELSAEDMYHFIKMLGYEKIHVVGLSQGAVVAQLLGIHHPEVIDKLVLADSYSEMPNKTAEWVLSLTNLTIKLIPYQTILNLMMKVYKDDEYTKKVLMDTMSIDKKMLMMMKSSTLPNVTEDLNKIHSPTLVMCGDKVVTGINEHLGSQKIYDHLPNATWAVFHDAFDPVSTMRKDEFNEMLIDFLQDRPLKPYGDVAYHQKHE
jgi:3-oxoadipate enol-lactonase